METSELIRRASKRDISTYDNLSLYFDTVRLETDFEKARPHYERIYDIAAQQKVKLALSDQQTAIKFYELAKKAALMLAPHLFHYYLLYVEWDREPQKKIYVPRMNVLKPVVDALQRLEERKLKRLTISMPPRTGKSTLGMFFMSWVAGRHPLGSSALTGYSDTLTKTFFDEADFFSINWVSDTGDSLTVVGLLCDQAAEKVQFVRCSYCDQDIRSVNACLH